MKMYFIRFRARKFKKKRWIVGPAKHSMFGGSYIWLDEENDWVSVNSSTLCAFMHIYDNNEKGVFEGDIVRDRAGRIMKIVYHNFKYQFEAITETNFKYADFYEWQVKPYQSNFNKRKTEEHQLFNFEIIGNIFDNPELLNES